MERGIIKRMHAITKLHELQANITGIDPEEITSQFVAKVGPDWHNYITYAMFDTIVVQNQRIMELTRMVNELMSYKQQNGDNE